jgi:hypothetical protein
VMEEKRAEEAEGWEETQLCQGIKGKWGMDREKNGLDRTNVKGKMTLGHCNGHELFWGTKYSSDDTCISMLPAAVQQSRRLTIWVMFASLTIFRYFGPLPIEREMYEYLCFQIRTQDMRKCARADEKWTNAMRRHPKYSYTIYTYRTLVQL